jgi:hypothetical protein
LEHFWNDWGSAQSRLLLLVCGSATSWVVKELLRNRAGLHNRVTARIALEPFTLGECEALAGSLGLELERPQVLDAYLALGGVPFYFQLMRPAESVSQSLDRLLFSPTAPLAGEFEELYGSLFRSPEAHTAVLRALGSRLSGLTRQEIVAATKLPDGGGLTDVLANLEQCGFVRSYHDFTRPTNGAYIQLIDPFSLFHLRFLEDRTPGSGDWLSAADDAARRVWSGYAFELACLLHVPQIKARLGISGVTTAITGWRSRETSPGAQIDLILDRRDKTINLCEMKYAGDPYAIDASYAATLRHKKEVFRAETGTPKDLHTTLITPYGVQPGQNTDVVASQVTLDDLFRAV